MTKFCQKPLDKWGINVVNYKYRLVNLNRRTLENVGIPQMKGRLL